MFNFLNIQNIDIVFYPSLNILLNTPENFLIVFILIYLLFVILGKVANNENFTYFSKIQNKILFSKKKLIERIVIITIFSILFLFFSFILMFYQIYLNKVNLVLPYCFNLLLYSNKILFFKGLIFLNGFFCLFLSLDYIKKYYTNLLELTILILIAILGSIIVVSSKNLLMFYLALELQAISYYILAASLRTADKSIESGIKYFFFGSLGSSILLLGISLIYGFIGSLDFIVIKNYFFFSDLLSSSEISKMAILGFLLIILGILFKLGAGPFHGWLPDIYEGAPIPIALFFTTNSKLTYIAFLLNFLELGFSIKTEIQYLLGFTIISSFLFGILNSTFELKIKRFLAFSSITHIGFILLGLYCYTQEAFLWAYMYVIFYCIISWIFWGIIMNNFIVQKKQFISYLYDFANIAEKSPKFAIILILTLASLAGLPPTAGFFVKFSILYNAFATNNFILFYLGIFVSGLIVFYYLRIIKLILDEKKHLNQFFLMNTSKITSAAIIICFLISIYFIEFTAKLFFNNNLFLILFNNLFN